MLPNRTVPGRPVYYGGTATARSHLRGVVKKRLLLVVGAAGLIVVLGVVGYWLYVDYRTSPASWPTEVFSSADWKAANADERYVFYRDLARSRVLDAVPRRQVIELLGPPSYEDPGGRYVTYVVKHADPSEPSFNFIYYLSIEFDPATRTVASYMIRAD